MTLTQKQTFATVGVSTKGGAQAKFRFTNRGAEAYGDILIVEGHTNVFFVDLPAPLTKAEAVAAFVALHPAYATLRVPGVKPVGTGAKRGRKAVELTAEQIAAAKAADKRARDAARKREKRAEAKAQADAAVAGATADDKLANVLADLDMTETV